MYISAAAILSGIQKWLAKVHSLNFTVQVILNLFRNKTVKKNSKFYVAGGGGASLVFKSVPDR